MISEAWRAATKQTGLLRLFVVLLALTLLAGAAGIFDATDRRLFDTLTTVRRAWLSPATPLDVVVVGIDEDYLNTRSEPMALMHPDLADFLLAMQLGKARVVALDLVLPEKSTRGLNRRNDPAFDFDRTLVRALMAAKQQIPVVMGKTWNAGAHRYRDISIDLVAAASPSRDGSDPRASVLVCPDADGVVRRYPGQHCQPDAGASLPFAAAVAAHLGIERKWEGYIDYAAGPAMRPIPLKHVLALYHRGDATALQAVFAGQPVLLGPVLPMDDRFSLPFAMLANEPEARDLPGVFVHAQILRGMLNGGLIAAASSWLTLVLPALGLIFLAGRSRARKLAMLFGACVMAAVLSLALLQHRLWLPTSGFMLAACLASACRASIDRRQAERQRYDLRRAFGGLVSPPVLGAILAGRLHPEVAGHQTYAAILFSDIRGFTHLSATLPAVQVVALLNDYLSEMSVVIHAHQGTVDKFMGDGIMAVFGSPEPFPDCELKAMAAAREMLQRLVDFNRRHPQTPLNIGIGIHAGKVVVGNVGSPARFEFTAVGDVVNTASRLEELSKTLGFPVIVSDTVASAVGSHLVGLVDLGEQAIRGREPVHVFGWNIEQVTEHEEKENAN